MARSTRPVVYTVEELHHILLLLRGIRGPEVCRILQVLVPQILIYRPPSVQLVSDARRMAEM